MVSKYVELLRLEFTEGGPEQEFRRCPFGWSLLIMGGSLGRSGPARWRNQWSSAVRYGVTWWVAASPGEAWLHPVNFTSPFLAFAT